MPVVELEHPDLSQHQTGIFQHLAAFRQEGQLCDVVVKSREGTQHRAHMAVLCAASEHFKHMLLGPFREAGQAQQGQPVEIPASNAVVAALLEYIYGGRPKLELEDSIELLSLVDAYHLPQLALGLEAGLHGTLNQAPVATALKIVQLTHSLHDLKDSCEEKIAANFESCIEHDDFLNLTAAQLARIIEREDLQVSREEIVMKGLFSWLKASKERAAFLGVLLRHVDLQSLSSSNLIRVRQLSASLGPSGHDLQREVDGAWRACRKRNARDGENPSAFDFHPKRRCLKHWSPDLGASAPHFWQRVAPKVDSMCYQEGVIYTVESQGAGSIMCRKPGEVPQAVAREGAAMNGVNRIDKMWCKVSVTPTGEIFVAEFHGRLLAFQNGSGKVVLSDVAGLQSVHCSSTGGVYVVTEEGRVVSKLVGATLQPLISSESLPPHLRFKAASLFESKDNAIYLSDCDNGRILRITPSEGTLVVIGQAPKKLRLDHLHITEAGKIYVTERGLNNMLWLFEPADGSWTRVLQSLRGTYFGEVTLDGSSLFLNMCVDWLAPCFTISEPGDTTSEPCDGTSELAGVYKIDLPAALLLN